MCLVSTSADFPNCKVNWEPACAEEQLDVPYQEVKEVVFIGRGVGAWGDMVITLKNNDKIEMRSLPRCVSLLDHPTSLMAAASFGCQGATAEGHWWHRHRHRHRRNAQLDENFA